MCTPDDKGRQVSEDHRPGAVRSAMIEGGRCWEKELRPSGSVNTEEKCRERCFVTFWYRVNETRADSSEEDMTELRCWGARVCVRLEYGIGGKGSHE